MKKNMRQILNGKLNIYRNELYIKYELERLDKSGISKANKDEIKRYMDYLLANNILAPRIARPWGCAGLPDSLICSLNRHLKRISRACIANKPR